MDTGANQDNNLKLMEILKGQCDTYWTNFDRRRAYEWKLSLAIWTVLAAFIALTLQGRMSLPSKSDCTWTPYVVVILTGVLAGVAIVLIQGYFQHRVKLANDVDKAKTELYEHLLNEAFGVSYFGTETRKASPEEEKVGDAIKKVKPSYGRWSLKVHVGITVILISLAIFVICSKIYVDHSSPQKATTNSETTSVKAVMNP